jgi:hypothetical protein
MDVTRWMTTLTTLVALCALPTTSAVAADGVEATVVTQPDSKRKSYRTRALKRGLGTTIAVPDVLVGWNSHKRGKPWGPRYFDESGRVFTHGQVAHILKTQVAEGVCVEGCALHLAEHERHRGAHIAWTVANSLGVAEGWAIGNQIRHGVLSRHELGRAAEAYTYR